MNNKQLEVLKWFHSGRNYQLGVSLFMQFGKNRVLQNVFLRKKEEYAKEKLTYELCKSVGLNWKQMPPLPDNVVISQPVQYSQPLPFNGPIVSDKPINQYPKIIRRIKYERSEIYNKRSMLHKKMGDVPAIDTPANNDTRADLLHQINQHSVRLDFLYSFVKIYEDKGTLPTENEVWPKPKQSEEKPLSLDELKRLKKNLQTRNTRDRNELNFQQNTQSKRKNPMPEGPKRIKLEKRVAGRYKEIDTINEKIKQLQKSDVT